MICFYVAEKILEILLGKLSLVSNIYKSHILANLLYFLPIVYFIA